ncbi:hypothetical protein Aduo_008698 [Ancylostoma duodenale]
MPSPFLLAATTHYHLDQYEHDRKLVEEMKENLYVDNLILCVDTAEEATYTCSRTKQMFKELNMNLREFASNNPETMKSIPDKDRSSEHVPKVLGIKWDSATDHLDISCSLENNPRVTKRIVASAIASIYDPLGWLVPLLHKAKVFLRLLWKENFDWDTKLPQERENEWTRIGEEIRGFRKIIPRFLCCKQANPMIITFADASAEAIASCVYLRSSHSANLMMAKGKLPTLKSATTMPKMELNAATLAMRLTNSVVSQLQSVLTIQQVFIFSDSEIVLGWIRKKPLKDAGLMVFNRLVEIDKIIANLQNLGCHVQFGHVPSTENPADCGTRGLGKTEFLNHFWWEGPKFLKKEPQTWAKEYKLFHSDSSSEGNEEEQATHKEVLVSTSTKTPRKPSCVDIFSPLQSYPLAILKRIVAYMLRFIRILVTRISKKRTHPAMVTPLLKEPLEAQNTSLSAAEIVIASKILVKQHQLATITQVIIRSMPHLNVQKDEEGLFRCFGRLGNSTLENETRNPLIILQNSWLAQAVIRDYHIKGHPGISHTMALVRQKFWIPKLRAQVTRLIRRCIPCQRLNNLPYKYPMQSDLPKRRVQKSRPFEHVGLDYFGPLPMTLTDGSQGKCYGAILTCMVTRMVHLDIASDLSTVAFLRLLRRFFGRRGIPRTITSDNAPTFTMGETILKDCVRALEQNPSLSRELSNREIEWRHITPYAPWQGGVYERLIQSVKHSIKPWDMQY